MYMTGWVAFHRVDKEGLTENLMAIEQKTKVNEQAVQAGVM